MLSVPSRAASAVPAWLRAIARDPQENEKRLRTCWPSPLNPRLLVNMAEDRPVIRRKVTTDITHSVSSTPTPSLRPTPAQLPSRPGFSRPPSRARYDAPGSVEHPTTTPKARVNLASITSHSASPRTAVRSSPSTPTPHAGGSTLSDYSPNVTTRRVRSPIPAVTPSIGQRVTAIVSPAPRPSNPTAFVRVRSAGSDVPPPKPTTRGPAGRQASAPVPIKSTPTLHKETAANASGSSSEVASPSSGSSIGLSTRSPPPDLDSRARPRIAIPHASLPTDNSYDETSIWLDVGPSRTAQGEASAGPSTSPATLAVPRPGHQRRDSNHLQLEAEDIESFEPSSFEDRIQIPKQPPTFVPLHLRNATTHISAPNSPLFRASGGRKSHTMQQSRTPDIKAINLDESASSTGHIPNHPPPLPPPPRSPNMRCAPLPDVELDGGDDVVTAMPRLSIGSGYDTHSSSGSGEEEGSVEQGVDEDSVDSEDISELEIANEAKVNRKVEDLEISNGSLLALNQSLEAANAQYRLEIRRLRRLTRAGSSNALLTPERRGHTKSSAPQSDSDLDVADSASESDADFASDRHAQSEVVLNRLVALVDVMRTRAHRSLEERGVSGVRVLAPGEQVRS